MKKLLCSILVGTAVLASSSTLYAGDNVSVYVDNVKVSYDAEPVIRNGSTLVPLRKTFEVLGANVDWNANTKTVTSKKGDNTVKLTIGSNTAYKNNKSFNVPVSPTIINSNTYVPLRFVSESFDSDVKWDSATKSVYISTNGSLDTSKHVERYYVTPSGEISTLEDALASKNALDKYITPIVVETQE